MDGYSMVGKARMIASLAEIEDGYSAIFCDVWGVVHNGVQYSAAATAALQNARAKGLAVVLITNAPRPAPPIVAQLAALGVPEDAWDRTITSGDVTRELVREGPRKIFHLGPDRDLMLYDGLDVEICEESEARGVVCTGLYDDTVDKPEDYADLLRRLRGRDLPLVCANPDIVVERGHDLIWCAGALARDYAQLGGRTLIAGKPHKPIYDAALKAAGEVLGREVDRREVLAIGDGILTDVKGAANNGFDILYVSGGVHSRDYGEIDRPDIDLLEAFLVRHGHEPVAVIPQLR
jgi:HAD superfamily hydrolase (TIGR01459 family)